MSTVEDLEHDRSGGRRYQRSQELQRSAGVENSSSELVETSAPKAACNGNAVQGSDHGISVAKKATVGPSQFQRAQGKEASVELKK